MPDFIIIVGRDRSTVNAESVAGRRFLRKLFATSDDSLTISSEFVNEIEKQLTDEGYYVTIR